MVDVRLLADLPDALDSAAANTFLYKTAGGMEFQTLEYSDIVGYPTTGIDSAGIISLIDSSYASSNVTEGFNVTNFVDSGINSNITKDSAGVTVKLGNYSKGISNLYLDSSSLITIGTHSFSLANNGEISFFGGSASSYGISSGSSSAVVIENSNYTSFLLKTDSTQTDAQVDASTNSATITETGNVRSTAFTPYHPGGYSTYFDGNGDYFTYTAGNEIGFGTGDFTVEFWAYPDYSGNLNNKVIDTRNASDWIIQLDARSTPIFTWYDGSSSLFSYDISTTENKWTHFAVTREGTSLRLFVNGTLADTLTDNNNYTVSSGDVYIGRRYNDTLDYFDGYLRDLRIVKGTAVYTTDFTPPTEPLTAIAGTQLLTCHLPYIADGSTNGHAITIYGNTSTKRFDPYEHVAYSTSSHGGSVYFDGSGDYLTTPSNTGFDLGTGDFTIEAWIYPTALSGNHLIVDTYVSGDNGSYQLYWRGTGSSLAFYNVGDGVLLQDPSSSNIVVNTWNHVAVSRSGTSAKLFVNGTVVDTATNSRDLTHGNTLAIGAQISTLTNFFNGYITDVRIVKGTAVYTADFTPPTEPLTAISGTQLLTCTNKNSIYDISSGSLLTLNGNTTTDTNTTKYSNSSVYFDGTGDYLTIPAASGIDISTGDFSIEAWVYPTAITNSVDSVFGYGNFRTMLYHDGSTWTWEVGNGSSNHFSLTATTTLNSWQHIVLTRSGNTYTFWLNGVSVSTTSNTNGPATSSVPLYIGLNDNSSNQNFTGYIEDLRLTKGLARYSSAFTPPTAALEA